jgi:glycosyltransferase involved in cell wall biosynthesis
MYEHLFLYMLACIGAHRLWNHEAVFAPVLVWLRKKPYYKPLWCPACNAWWICLFLAAIVTINNDFSTLFIAALAAYPVVRWLAWGLPSTAPAPAFAQAVLPAATPDAAPVEYEHHVVLLTALHAFDPSYSLVGVILDQARMLAADPKTQVQIWVVDGCEAPPALPVNVQVLPIIPRVSWQNDQVISADVDRIASVLFAQLRTFKSVSVITHDLLFQASFVTFSAAIRKIPGFPWVSWFHQAHSAAALNRPVGIVQTMRATVPAGHRLLAISVSDASFMAQYYGTDINTVVVIPNSRDIRQFHQLDPVAGTLIDTYRLLDAEVVQVYPLSGTRMDSKGVPTLISLFGAMRKQGRDARLVVVNAHSNGKDVADKIAYYRSIAVEAGLTEGLYFTSEDYPASAHAGMSAATVSGLFQVSNLFVFPTISEACPLVLMEAAISGCLLVLNSSVPALFDIVPHSAAISFPFGGVRERGATVDVQQAAAVILDALDGSLANQSKRTVLRNHNYTALGAQLRAAIFPSL